MTRLILAALLIIAATVQTARARLLKAIRPGVMCASADALAKLTLPDGSSRTAAPNPSPAMQAIADEGNCNEFSKGFVVVLQTARKNTSIVGARLYYGNGLDTMIVPNVDFAAYAVPRDPFFDVIRARCPDRLEAMVVLGPPAHAFVDTLPAATRLAIERAVTAECQDYSPCLDMQRPAEVSKRHLDQKWAEFDCAHPD